MPFVEVHDHRIHYHDTAVQAPERGRGKPPILMIHGLGSTQNYYMPVIPRLDEYRCIAMDTYGAGRSLSQGEDLTMYRLADDIIGVLDHLHISQAILIGHSMGGPMVLTAAAHHPARVVGVIAIGPVKPKAFKPELFTARIDTVMKDGMEPLANTVPTAATGRNSTWLQKALIRELILGQNPKSYASLCRVIIDMEDPKGGFAAVQCPVLILAGEEDQSAPLSGCEAIVKELGSTEKSITILPGIGHWHCIEASEEVADAVKKFAAQIQA